MVLLSEYVCSYFLHFLIFLNSKQLGLYVFVQIYHKYSFCKMILQNGIYLEKLYFIINIQQWLHKTFVTIYRVVFTPPVAAKVNGRMKNLFTWLKDNDQHPIVRSAIFHHEFLTIHPFVDGNGRVARAMAQWLLWEKGMDPLVRSGIIVRAGAARAVRYRFNVK